MKKIKIIIALAIFIAALETASAQTGIGARGMFGLDGNAYGGLELSIQKIGRSEFDLGWGNDSWKFTTLKLFNFIGGRSFGFYGGFGVGVGYNTPVSQVFGTLAADLGTYLLLGPIQLGLDWRPEWNIVNAPNADVGFNLALSARLVFGNKSR